MYKKKYNDITVSFHDDCKTIPIKRLNEFKKYMQLDMGLTPDKFMEHANKIGKIANYLNSLDKKGFSKEIVESMYQELSNLHISLFLSSNGISFRYMALATLVQDINGKAFEAYEDPEELESIITQLQDHITDEEVSIIIEDSKKKFLTNLR